MRSNVPGSRATSISMACCISYGSYIREVGDFVFWQQAWSLSRAGVASAREPERAAGATFAAGSGVR